MHEMSGMAHGMGVSSASTSQNFPTKLLDLPNELLLFVFFQVDVPDLYVLSTLSRRLQLLCIPLYLECYGIKDPLHLDQASITFTKESFPAIRGLRIATFITAIKSVNCVFSNPQLGLSSAFTEIKNVERLMQNLSYVSHLSIDFGELGLWYMADGIDVGPGGASWAATCFRNVLRATLGVVETLAVERRLRENSPLPSEFLAVHRIWTQLRSKGIPQRPVQKPSPSFLDIAGKAMSLLSGWANSSTDKVKRLTSVSAFPGKQLRHLHISTGMLFDHIILREWSVDVINSGLETLILDISDAEGNYLQLDDVLADISTPSLTKVKIVCNVKLSSVHSFLLRHSRITSLEINLGSLLMDTPPPPPFHSPGLLPQLASLSADPLTMVSLLQQNHSLHSSLTDLSIIVDIPLVQTFALTFANKALLPLAYEDFAPIAQIRLSLRIFSSQASEGEALCLPPTGLISRASQVDFYYKLQQTKQSSNFDSRVKAHLPFWTSSPDFPPSTNTIIFHKATWSEEDHQEISSQIRQQLPGIHTIEFL